MFITEKTDCMQMCLVRNGYQLIQSALILIAGIFSGPATLAARLDLSVAMPPATREMRVALAR